MSISVEFQKRLQELVNEQPPQTQSSLAQAINVSPHTLSLAMLYGIVPKPATLAHFADYFDVSIKYLLGQTDDLFYRKANSPSTFHERLCELLKERKLTRYQLAKKCHFDKSSISHWFKKHQTPNWEIFDLLTDYFNVSPDYLLGRTDDRN